MKILLVVLLALLSFSSSAVELSEEETSLIEQVKSLRTAYEMGDVDKIVESTFQPLIKAAGGSDAFKHAAMQAMQQQALAGIFVQSADYAKPTAPISAGNYTLRFVPTVLVMKMPGKRGKSTGFTIAIREINSTDWRFLDGAGLRKNPSMLRTLFPELPENLSLPENKIELIP
jgi:hypothetical protein